MRLNVLLLCAKDSTKVPRGHWSNENVQREVLERFGREKLGVKELDDWYKVKGEDVKHHLSFIRNYYNSSLISALKKLYPQHHWDPLRFKMAPRGYWNDESTQREALERLGREKFGVKELDDWYHVPIERIRSELTFIKNYYKGSLYDTLKALYPQHEWNRHKFNTSKMSSENYQRGALEKFGSEKFGVKELDDWYTVPATDVHREFGFVKKYGSLYNALKTLYPQHDWNPLKFSKLQMTDVNIQREALQKFGREKLGVKELDDWYAVPAEKVRELSFIKKYGSLMGALKKLYPQHNWDPLKFSSVPRGYWTNPNTQREALERVGTEKFEVKELDDWYSVPAEKVRNELNFIRNHYNGSLPAALKTLYPQHRWDPLRFQKVPAFWMNMHSYKKSLEKLGQRLGVKDLDDWYNVPATSVRRGLNILHKYGSVYDALSVFYPQHNWDPLRFSKVPPGYWQRASVVQHYREMFTEWKRVHNIRSVSDWHELPPHQVEVFKRASMGIFGSKLKMLQEWFPETVWHSQFTSQNELQTVLKHSITDDHLKHAGVDSGALL